MKNSNYFSLKNLIEWNHISIIKTVKNLKKLKQLTNCVQKLNDPFKKYGFINTKTTTTTTKEKNACKFIFRKFIKIKQVLLISLNSLAISIH